MLQAFPGQLGKQRVSLNRSATAVSYTTTTMAAGATIGTYAATWSTVIASTPFDATALRITNTTSLASSGLRSDIVVIIATGASTAEVQKIGPLLFGARPIYSSYTVPIFIPSGSRISIKTAAGQVSRSASWSIDVMGGPNRDMGSLPTAWIAYGAAVSSGAGAHGTAHTYGNAAFSSWAALATTTQNHDLWLPMVGCGTNTAFSARDIRTQYALGSTTEAATMVTNNTGIINGTWLTSTANEALGLYNIAGSFGIGLDDVFYSPTPSGSALAIRACGSSGAADANVLTMALLAAVK